MAASLEWCFTFGLDLNPLLLSNVVDPEIVKLLRAVIFASKHVHIAIVNAGCVAATGAWNRVTGRDLHVLPLVRGEVVSRSLVSPVALLETSEDDHLGGVLVDNCSVLVTEKHLVATGADHRPTHCTQVQVEKLVSIQVIVVRLNTVGFGHVTAEKVHVVLPNDRSVIGDVTGDVRSVA